MANQKHQNDQQRQNEQRQNQQEGKRAHPTHGVPPLARWSHTLIIRMVRPYTG